MMFAVLSAKRLSTERLYMPIRTAFGAIGGGRDVQTARLYLRQYAPLRPAIASDTPGGAVFLNYP